MSSQHYCGPLPETIEIIFTGPYGAGSMWILLQRESGERSITLILNLKYCPFCGRELPENG